jgi:hypothetical protein
LRSPDPFRVKRLSRWHNFERPSRRWVANIAVSRCRLAAASRMARLASPREHDALVAHRGSPAPEARLGRRDVSRDGARGRDREPPRRPARDRRDEPDGRVPPGLPCRRSGARHDRA